MSIRRKFNPNAGDRTYRMILRRSLAPNRNKTSDYADNNHDYADDTPDYSNYSGDDEGDDGGDEDNDDSEDEDGGDEDNGGGEDEDKNSKGDSNKKNKDDNRDKLRNAEKNGSNSNSNNKNSSLAKRERSSSGGKGFNYNKGRSGRSGGGGFKGFMGRHKNGVLGGITGTFVFGGMMSGSMLLSGPTQFIQIMHFIRNTYNIVRELQSTLREAKNTKSILIHTRGKTDRGDSAKRIDLDDTALLQKYGEVGLLSSNSSVKYAERLEKIGIITKLTGSDIKMYIDHKHLEINWRCKGGDCVAKQVVNKLGGKIGDYTVNGHSIEINLDEVRNSGGLFKEHYLRKFFANLGRKSGQHFWTRWSGQRAFAKATNIVYGFHPFIRAKNIIKDKITDFLSGVSKKLATKSKTYAKAVALYNKTRVLFKGLRNGVGVKLSLSDQKGDSKDTSNLRKQVNDGVNAASDDISSNLDSSSDSIIRNPAVAKGLQIIGNTLNWVGTVVSMVCVPVQMAHQVEKFRWLYHVIPAIQLSIEVISSAGQMMAGRMSMAQLSVMSRKQFYDEYAEVPWADGKFESSSWWDSAPVNAELGLPVNEGKTAYVPGEVQSVSEGTILSKITGKTPKETKSFAVAACDAINSNLGQIVQYSVSTLTTFASFGTTTFVNAGFQAIKSLGVNYVRDQITSALANALMGQIISMMTGKALDVTNQLPAQFGDITAYGSKFNQSQNGLHGSGGAVLSEKATAEINRQKNVWLAEEWNDKPLLAKLFDPTDYRSMLGTLARNARLNSYPENILASISNTFKLVAAIPNTAVAMAINSPAQTALAASGAQRYDYGVPEVAIPPSTLDSFTENNDDDDKSEMNNAEKVMDIFHSEETEKAKLREKYTEGSKEFNNALLDWEDTKEKYTELAKVCLAKDIDDDGRVSDDTGQNSENGGFTFMYLTGNSENTDYVDNNCAGKLDKDNGAYDETLARIAMYAGPDIYRARTTECLANPEDSYSQEACVGAGLAYKQGSNGNGPDFGTFDPGGVPSSEMAKRFMRDTLVNTKGVKYSYSFGGNTYDSTNNGCTTVPFWFINKYTTLKYGHGNGGQVAGNLAAANGLGKPTNVPRPYSIFSSRNGAMSSDGPLGHTGLVTQVDQDGTIHTLEVWFTDHEMHECTYKPSDYANNVDFVYVGDHLKNIPNGPSYSSKMEMN